MNRGIVSQDCFPQPPSLSPYRVLPPFPLPLEGGGIPNLSLRMESALTATSDGLVKDRAEELPWAYPSPGSYAVRFKLLALTVF